MQIQQLHINLDYEKMLPLLNYEQYEALKKSIQNEGQHYPIAYNFKYEVLDGHHRLKICQELGIEPKIEDLPRIFENKLSEKQFVLETNLIRRHLDTWHRILVAKPLLEIYREKTQQRQTNANPQGINQYSNCEDLPKNLGKSYAKGEAIEQFAQAVHSNPETVRQALFIEEKARPEVKEKLSNNEITINAAYVQTKSDEKRNEIQKEMPPLPDGKYRCIVIDPPWPIEKIEREVRPNQTTELDYLIMSLEEIENLPIYSLAHEEGCHVYLWTTHKFLPEAFNLFKKWEIRYECLLTWVKNVGFTPFSWMYNTEHVIFGRIGSLKLMKLGVKLSFEAPITKHSEKPDIFFEIAKQASPSPRLEMFSRKNHEGFKSWGNEANTI